MTTIRINRLDGPAARRRYRWHQRGVLEALIREGAIVNDIRRDYPRLDWTRDELDALAREVYDRAEDR